MTDDFPEDVDGKIQELERSLFFCNSRPLLLLSLQSAANNIFCNGLGLVKISRLFGGPNLGAHGLIDRERMFSG